MHVCAYLPGVVWKLSLFPTVERFFFPLSETCRHSAALQYAKNKKAKKKKGKTNSPLKAVSAFFSRFFFPVVQAACTTQPLYLSIPIE